jgi:hypothetical protein
MVFVNYYLRGGNGTASNWTETFVWEDIAAVSEPRAAMDGTHPHVLTSLRFVVGGRGGTVTLRCFIEDGIIGNAQNPTFYGSNVNIAATSSGSIVQDFPLNKFFRDYAAVPTNTYRDDTGHNYSGERYIRVGLNRNGGASTFWWAYTTPGANPATRPGDAMWDEQGFSTVGVFAGGFNFIHVPQAPNSPSVTPSTDGSSAAVSWTFSGDNGGSAITGYRLQYNSNSAFTGQGSTIDVPGTSATVTGLTAGSTYFYRVTARNTVSDQAGLPGGNWSGTTSRAQTSLPGAPSISGIEVNPNGISVAVSLAAPSSGPTPTSYTIQVSTSSVFQTILKSQTATSPGIITVTGLSPETTYYFRASATNASGTGPFSGSSSAKTPGLPSAPTLTSVTPSVDGKSATIVFDGSGVQDGGSAITGYDLQRATDINFQQNAVISSVNPGTTTIIGLTPGTQYWWRLRAKNAVGPGPYSAALNPAQPNPGFGEIFVGGNFTLVDGRIRNGGVFVEVDARIRNAANTGWVEVGTN